MQLRSRIGWASFVAMLAAGWVCSGMADAAIRSVTVSNVDARRNAADGSILDVHDGCLERFGDSFYLYGTAYGNTDGFGKTNRYVCYTSRDLVHWSLVGDLLRDPPPGVYYRPYVKYNTKTRQYVLWYNWYAELWNGQYGVATSDTPTGPFTIRNDNVKVRNPKPGDLGLFVDDDGAGYLIYTSIGLDHGISVERLADDHLSSTMQGSDVIAAGCEACSMIKRNGVYYAFFDNCCCFCPEGSGVRVYTAQSPLGPFTGRGNINRRDDGSIIIPAQQTHIARISTSKGVEFIWMGDRWGSRPDGIKGHDFQYWSSPLQFAEDGSVKPLKWEDKWLTELDIPDAVPSAVEAKPSVDADQPGAIRFWGTDVAELYTKEIAESYRGVLSKNYVSQPGGEFPIGFVHASPIPQGWSGTFWTRDGGTFLREMAQWGYYDHARLTAQYLMDYIAPNEEGFYSYPEYFSGAKQGSGTELDGTSSIIIGMVILWQRLPDSDPLRARIYQFLHRDTSPVRYVQKQVHGGPLVAGSGEFGGGCGIPGMFYNVTANNLADYALLAAGDMEAEAGDTGAAGQLRRDAWTLRRGIEKYLVSEDGSWTWCIDPSTLKPDPAVINNVINRGFGGLNGPACMYSDALGFDPVGSGWWGVKPSMKTFDKLFSFPLRKQQFEKWGMWTQFDEFRAGYSSAPSYGDGYAIQTMLLYDKLDMADKGIGWVATSTYTPIPEYKVDRESRYYFYEQSYTPDAVGKTAIGQGCGALNLVNVTEQLKVARLILGVDDTSADVVKIIPRLPVSWKGVEAGNWPIRTSVGIVRADIRFEKKQNGNVFRIKLASGQPISKLAVRMPAGKGFSWRTETNVSQIELRSE